MVFRCYLHRAEATAFGCLRGGHRIWMLGTVALKQQCTELGGTFTNEAVFGDHKHPSKAAEPANDHFGLLLFALPFITCAGSRGLIVQVALAGRRCRRRRTERVTVYIFGLWSHNADRIWSVHSRADPDCAIAVVVPKANNDIDPTNINAVFDILLLLTLLVLLP
jgi:hypothetical protein